MREKTAGNVVEELEHFNAWGAHENGEGWSDVTLQDLRNAHRQRVQDIQKDKRKTGKKFHQEEILFGELIEQAITAEEEMARIIRLGARAALKSKERVTGGQILY